jgi:hypothetical protein
VVLLVFAQIYLTKIHADLIQQVVLSLFALAALWQAYVKLNIDLLCLLLSYLGLNIFFSLYRTDNLSLLFLIIACASLVFIITIWQGHRLFAKNLLWRHAYIVALGVTEIAVVLCYWYIFNDPSTKALILTLILYLSWGTLELESENNFRWKNIKGFITITLLLVIFVLVTMEPAIEATIH